MLYHSPSNWSWACVIRWEIVALIGSIGAGKSTVLNTLSGLLPARAGRASFTGIDLLATPPQAIVRAGTVQVPEGREILARLTVEENLSLGAWTRADRAQISGDIEEMMGKISHIGGAAPAGGRPGFPAASSRSSPSPGP
jgi:branched-chain amino acid transport system ATP-binding protein